MFAIDEIVPVPLTVLGGAVTEMAPEDLPEGASPFNQDVDFLPGSVFSRAGRQSVYAFSGLAIENLAGFAQTLPGAFAPNEAAWSNPANATVNTPGTYAIATLDAPSLPPSGPGTLIQFSDTSGAANSDTYGTLTPTGPSQVAVWISVAANVPTVTPGTLVDSGTGATVYTAPVANPTSFSATFSAGIGVAATGRLFGTTGALTVAQHVKGQAVGFANGATLSTPAMTNPVPGTDAVILCFAGITPGVTISFTVTDDQNNVYTLLGQSVGAALTVTAIYVCLTPLGGPKTFSIKNTGSAFGASSINLFALDVAGLSSSSIGVSQVLQASNFNFNIPVSASILGVQLEVFGHQTTIPADAILTANLLTGGGIKSPLVLTAQLPTVDGQVNLGDQAQLWQLPLTPALLNNPSFAVQLVASAATVQSFSIYAVKLKVFTSPANPANFNWIKTYEQTSAQIDTLALDANGILYDENVTSSPNVLASISTAVNPGSFAKSETFANVEYIAFSNLLNGTDIPRHWDGTFLDRVSQVGPGAPPSVNATGTSFGIAPAPTGITQNPAVTHDNETTGFRAVLWSAGPGNTSTGNVITVYYSRVNFGLAAPDPNIVAGNGIQLQGLPFLNGNASQPVNGNYVVTSIGSGVPPNGNFSNPHFYFTVQAATSASGFQFTPNTGIAGTSYQVTIATLTTLVPLPNVQVGSQIQLTGVGVPAWNATWTILATPNAGQLSISQTQLSGNVATYTFALITGVAPTVGQQVTIVGCLNGPIVGGTSIFNISNGIVASVGLNQFSINITGPNVLPAAESANATVNGTKFQFDPGIQLAGQSVTNPIFGNSGGGSVIIGGAGLAAGVRKAVMFNLTRNGLLTQASPPVIFATTGATTSLAFSNIWVGPPNTIARIIAMTAAGGGNFFWIPQAVIVQSGGQNITYSSSMISDNVSTQATLTFTDAVLLAGLAIDIPGNNLFNQMELGSCRGFLTYADRLIAWGEQNKIQNLLNLSFDGNIGTGAGAASTYPVGWTVDAVNGAGGNLRVSPIFGNSYYILNATGGVQALYGMIEQGAFQDAYQVPIVSPNTKYSVRLSARCPSGAVTGNLVVDLFSPLQNRSFGSFTIALSAMTTNFQIFSGTLLTTTFQSVPPDLICRVYVSAIPNNGDVELDRVEPFPTLQPVFSTQFRASYAGNQEAFDLVTGAFGPAQNQQPINGGVVLFDSLLALKEQSMFSTSDNGVTEPFQWNWREVSKKVGTIGQNSYDSGEGWLVTACRPGVYFYEGGEPVKISQEIQSVWDLINWQYGHTIWLRNDAQAKRITVGIPIATPNAFMPEMPLNANPTTPNVILQCSYRELATGIELAHVGPIRSSFSGRLLSPEPARKWSFWNISSPYADFIARGNNQWPEFFCSGYQNSKVYQLNPAQLSDDGVAINAFYVTYGFVKPEMAEAKGLGLFRMEMHYITVLATGSGFLNTLVYPESVQNPLPFVLDTTPLPAISQGDLEVGALVTGDRFFVRVGTNALGAQFRLSKIVVGLTKDPWSPVRGTAVGAP